MKIKSIYIDGLHNAINKTYTFGDIVYIFGNNGVGKSTILTAIQFALLGYIPGTAKNSREALLRHSPTGRIEVKLAIANDQGEDILIQRIVDKKENRLDVIPEGYDISTIVSDIEIPIFNFNDFVSQTANKLKEYFIKNILPNTNGTLDWKQILTESIIDCNFYDRNSIIDYGMSLVSDLDGELLDQVIAGNTKFKEEQTFTKSELQRLQHTVDSLIYYDDYVGPLDPVALNSEILALGALRDQLIKYESAVKATQSAKDEYDALRNNLVASGGREAYDKSVAAVESHKQREAEISTKIAELADKISGMRAIDTSSNSIINSKGVCPYTKDSCKSIVNKIEELRNESVTRKAEMLALTTELDNLKTDLDYVRSVIRQHESVIQNITTIWGRLKTLEKTLGTIPDKPNTDKTVTDIDIELDTLNKNMQKLQANIKYNETIETITKDKYESELRNTALSSWIKKTDTNGLQTTLMLAPFEELADKMTSYIQQMYGNTELKAHFNISSKANSFSFGLIRNNVYIPYDLLSSGEKCLYALALMICIVDNCKSPLKVLLCDDMFDHLDSSTIENTFITLKHIKGIQFIFAGVKPCENAEDIILSV